MLEGKEDLFVFIVEIIEFIKEVFGYIIVV